MMGEVIKLRVSSETVFPLTCETCAEWDMLSAHFFVHSDGSFRCVECGASYVFANETNEGEEE